MKTMKAYAIKDPKGYILERSIQSTKHYCTFQYDVRNNSKFHLVGWKYYYNRGYRCVPVEITEIKPKGKCEHLNTRAGHSPFVACICNDCNEEI